MINFSDPNAVKDAEHDMIKCQIYQKPPVIIETEEGVRLEPGPEPGPEPVLVPVADSELESEVMPTPKPEMRQNPETGKQSELPIPSPEEEEERQAGTSPEPDPEAKATYPNPQEIVRAFSTDPYFQNTCFEVRASQVAGLGAFAVKDMSHGDIILKEKPLFVSDNSRLYEDFSKLDEQTKEVALSLYMNDQFKPDTNPVRAAWSTNW